jgi:DNA replication and repair protein RecF
VLHSCFIPSTGTLLALLYLSSLVLSQVRNYSFLSLRFEPGVYLVTGQNGLGKTNLLEAIGYLATGRSFRTSQDSDLILQGERGGQANLPDWAAELALPESTLLQAFARLEGGFSQQTPEGALLSEWKREARLLGQWKRHSSVATPQRVRVQFKEQGEPLKTRSQLFGKIPLIHFVASELELARGGPEPRRDWVDLVSQHLDATHWSHLAQLQRLLKQKSKWLKDRLQQLETGEVEAAAASEALDGFEGVLQTLNHQLASVMAQVLWQRLQTLYRLAPCIQGHYRQLCQGQDPELSLGYEVSGFSWRGDPLPETLDALHTVSLSVWEDRYREALNVRYSAELARGQCLVGPHRDKPLFQLGAWGVQQFASQGQQRSLVLALKLAEFDLVQQQFGQAPILLLDDVMAELDATRQKALLEQVKACPQVFLSTTHLELGLQTSLAESFAQELKVLSVERDGIRSA